MSMPAYGLGSLLRPPRALYALTFATLVFALLAGGGQGSLIESLLALLGLVLIVVAAVQARTNGIPSGRALWFWLVPTAFLTLPLLQLVALPYAVWSNLPGRAPLAAGLAAAGVGPMRGAWTVSPIATEGVLWCALVPAGVFMGAALLSDVQRRALVMAALAFAALSAFIGLWQLMDGPTSPLYLYRITNEGEAVGLFANRNHLASLLAVSLPITAGLLADRVRDPLHGARDLQVWWFTALMVLLSVSVTATRSRAGFGLLMLSVLASAVVLLSARKSRRWAGARPWLQMSAVLAGVLIVQFTLYGMLIRAESDPLDEHRWTLAANTVLAAQPARGLGYGLGTFVQAYDEIGDASADIQPYVNHAHDEYVELWLEGGVPAMLLTLGALSLLGAQVVRLLRAGSGDEGVNLQGYGLRIGATAALLLLALHSIVDYPLRTLTLATLAGLLAAVLLGPVRRHGRPPEAVARAGQFQ